MLELDAGDEVLLKGDELGVDGGPAPDYPRVPRSRVLSVQETIVTRRLLPYLHPLRAQLNSRGH